MQRSHENLNSNTLRELQLNFLKWAAAWTKNDVNLEPIEFDMPDVVNLLQAVGFRIRYINVTNATDMTPLRGGEKGSRIIITCNHSGQKCILEKPTTQETCKCSETPINSKDGFWEVTATTPKTTNRQSLIETGSDLIPMVTKEKSMLIRNVLNYLFHILNDQTSQENINTTPLSHLPGRKSEPFYATPSNTTPMRSSLGAKEKPAINPVVGMVDSPARYRSLDTLTSKDADMGLPEPGTLLPKNQVAAAKSDASVCQSSPNIKITADEADSSTSTIGDVTISVKAISLMKKASNDIIKAIALMEEHKTPNTPSVFEEKISSASKNIKKLLCTSKQTYKVIPSTSYKHVSSPNLNMRHVGLNVPKPISRMTIKSAGSTSKNIITAKVLATRKSTSSIASNIPKPDGVIRKITNKYANVKSTIPKGEAVKKKIPEVPAKSKILAKLTK